MAKNKKFLSDKYIVGLLTGVLMATLFLVLIPQAWQRGTAYFEKKKQEKIVLEKEKLPEEVMPANGVALGVKLNDMVVKMRQLGVIDDTKFNQLYKDRGGMSGEEEKIFNGTENQEIVVTGQNANFLLNILWPLGLVNKTTVLSEGPMGTTYKDRVGNFASTGGWTLGREDGGKIFNSFVLLPLTAEQEKEVKELAENIYRSCCGNSTYFPDCNHGAAMLGFLELAVSQGMNKEDIYRKALYLNSFWFPQTYLDLANYFLVKEKKEWKDLNPKLILSSKYSSGQGYAAVRREMQEMGILEKSQGGASCGV